MTFAYPIQQLYGDPICRYWPEQPLKAVDVALCESGLGRHPNTFNLGALHGGPLQIAESVWADWFLENYGWPWELVVTDPETHAHAARIIYDRSGDWSPWPVCGALN